MIQYDAVVAIIGSYLELIFFFILIADDVTFFSLMLMLLLLCLNCIVFINGWILIE